MAMIIPFIPLGRALLYWFWIWSCAFVLVNGTLPNVTQGSERQLVVHWSCLLLLLLGALNKHNAEELEEACWWHVAQWHLPLQLTATTNCWICEWSHPGPSSPHPTYELSTAIGVSPEEEAGRRTALLSPAHIAGPHIPGNRCTYTSQPHISQAWTQAHKRELHRHTHKTNHVYRHKSQLTRQGFCCTHSASF